MQSKRPGLFRAFLVGNAFGSHRTLGAYVYLPQGHSILGGSNPLSDSVRTKICASGVPQKGHSNSQIFTCRKYSRTRLFALVTSEVVPSSIKDYLLDGQGILHSVDLTSERPNTCLDGMAGVEIGR